MEVWGNHIKIHANCTVHSAFYWQYMQSLSHARHPSQLLPRLLFAATKTAHSTYFEHVIVVYNVFSGPRSLPRASIISIMGPVWTSNFLIDTAYVKFQHPSETLGMMRCLRDRNEGPIVLMMMARKNCPKPSVRPGHTPIKHSFARRASAMGRTTARPDSKGRNDSFGEWMGGLYFLGDISPSFRTWGQV